MNHALLDGLTLASAPVPYQPRAIPQGRGVRWWHLPAILRRAWRTRVKVSTAGLAGVLALTLAGLASPVKALPLPPPWPPSGSANGTFFNPVTDTNWNNLFPIVISGVPMGGTQPPTILAPSICVCPSHFIPGLAVPGVGMSYWLPQYIAEVTSHPGRLITLGGMDVLGASYRSLFGPRNRKSGDLTSGGNNRVQVHWYNYPLFSIISYSLGTACTNLGANTAVQLAFMTEIDPTWQSDLWANLFTPEAVLFGTPIMQAACSVDAAAAAVAYPLDPLYWCAGAWGSVYPLSGNPATVTSDQQSNALVLAKFLYKQFRLGLMWLSIGPTAICFAHPSPIWVKTQFRVNPIYPHPVYGPPIYIGQTAIRWGLMPPANYPLHQDSAYLIWQAHQCCIRP